VRSASAQPKPRTRTAPFALSLWKGFSSFFRRERGRREGFHRLSPNRVGKLSALALLLAAPAHADGLIDNVNGYTLDAKGKLERFTGLLIDGRGKIAKLLDRRDKRPDKLDFRLDAKGRTLIPGLIASEGHVSALGLQMFQLDLSDTRSLAEAQAKLARWSAEHANPRWIVGRGWSQEKWGLGRLPTVTDLDAAVANRPVWLESADGHAGLANSAAMALAKVDAATKAPPGGRIEKGLFVDSAMALVERIIPPPLPRERDIAIAKAQEILLSSGITATADMGTSAEDWNAFRRFGDAGVLRLRIISYAAGIDPLLSVAGAGPTPWLYGERLRMVGMELPADGNASDDSRLRNLMSRAAMDGFQVAIRAIGRGAFRQGLDAIEELALTYDGDRRWRIEQSEPADPSDLTRLSRIGVIASLRPDQPPKFPDPFAAIAAAPDREQALAAFTLGAAHAGFAEGRIGTLMPGKNADFLLLDRDIFNAAPEDVRAAQVMETWIGGVRAWTRK
jgi:predicted amidohydrolase YtcJ